MRTGVAIQTSNYDWDNVIGTIGIGEANPQFFLF